MRCWLAQSKWVHRHTNATADGAIPEGFELPQNLHIGRQTPVLEVFMKRPMSAKRLIAVGLSPGLLFLAVDSAIAHFAGKGIEQGPQMIPILFGVFGATLLGMLGLPFLRRVNFVPSRLIVRLVALGSMVVGAAGTGFHLVPLLKDLSDEPFSLSALEGALAVSPPLFAPAAFIGVGMVLYFLASPQLSLRLRPAPAQELDAELGDERQPITATQTLG